MCSLASLLLASGVIPTTGQWAQISAILGLLTGSAMYTASRAKLKVAAINGGKPAANDNRSVSASVSGIASTAGLFAILALLSVSSHAGCGGGSSVGASVASGGKSFLSCEKVDLQQMVDGKTFLATIAIDLASANYVGAIAEAVAKFGGDAVGCAVVAIEQVFGAGKAAGSAAGSGAPLVAALAESPVAARAREMMTKYNWAPKTATVTKAAP